MIHEPTWELYKDLLRLHIKAYKRISATRAIAALENAELPDLCDTVYALRQAAELSKRITKLAEDAAKSIERMSVMQWVKDNMNNLGKAEPVRGTVSIGTPTTGVSMTFPSKDSDDYRKFMGYFGFKGDLVDFGLASLHWPRTMEHINERIRAGKPMPPGLENVKKSATFVFKPLRRRGQQLRDRAVAEMLRDGEEIELVED